jgi:hypothetical protein
VTFPSESRRCSPNPDPVGSEGESGLAEAGDGVGGLGPEFRFSCGSAGLTAYEPQRASSDSPDGEHHLPFHASTLAAAISRGRYGVGL